MEYIGYLICELAEQFAATCKGRVEPYQMKVKLAKGHEIIDCWRVITDEHDTRMEVVSVRMPWSLYQRVRLYANNTGTYSSDVIRQAIEKFVG